MDFFIEIHVANSSNRTSDWFSLEDIRTIEELNTMLKEEGFDINSPTNYIVDFDSTLDTDNAHSLDDLLLILKSGITTDPNLGEIASAYTQVYGFNAWKELVKNKGKNWPCNMEFCKGENLISFAFDYLKETYSSSIDELLDYLDIDEFAEHLAKRLSIFEANDGLLKMYD